MIRISQIKTDIIKDRGRINKILLEKSASLLKIRMDDIEKLDIVKQSIDARHKPDIKYVFSVNVFVKNEKKINKRVFDKNVFIASADRYALPENGTTPLFKRPVVVGTGPAGLFCGYFLALRGFKPLIIERGQDVDSRVKTVNGFFQGQPLNTESNVQFGEGGAGTFSDGKLNTMVKDKDGRNREVLSTFVKFGAKEEILYINKPHIGTDVLCHVVKNMRQEIKRLGAEVRFEAKLTSFNYSNGILENITINNDEIIPCNILVLALGHSARDTFKMMYDSGIHIEPKAFAVGVRMEHPQTMINNVMYGVDSHEVLEAADYKVTYNSQNGRGVYSFCMCPGGYVVNASSENNRLAVNGMSYSGRNGENANSAIVVTVSPEDYVKSTPLDGIAFQRQLEENAFKEGEGKVPVQCFGDFENNKATEKLGDVKPCIKGEYKLGNLRNIFPDYISESIIEGIHGFSGQIIQFDRKDAILSGVESRTSSPVRITRDDNFQSNIKGIYPCGEGAGYAGGITSAAMDGMRIAEAIIRNYYPKY